MNNILQLKGKFEQKPNNSKPGAPSLPKNATVSAEHLRDLSGQLQEIGTYWKLNTDINGALISVHYIRVIPKSNRLRVLLSENSVPPTLSIRGAKFIWESDESGKVTQKHVFTHFVKLSVISRSIDLLNNVADMLDRYYGGVIDTDDTENLQKKYDFKELPKTNFLRCVMDGYFVERFDIDRPTEIPDEESIITIYRTGMETKKLLSNFGIYLVDDRIIDETTLRLHPDEVQTLYNKASYLISMSVSDFSEITIEDLPLKIEDAAEGKDTIIPPPLNEPVIGVIDTQFNTKVYFHDWVEYKNLLSEDIPLQEEDYVHGTEVSYILVDGPRGNPQLDDGCGRFRVRHFGIATHSGFSSFYVLKQLEKLVAENRDIKVWNLSLGSKMEINSNFISPEAYELDRIQSKYDVIFVIAGTNIPKGEKKKKMRIGAPADSLNSLVVNAVDFKGKPASYTRVGPVLSFFNKPDVSFYGGDGADPDGKIVVCANDLGAAYVNGTSFAAPWIARKLTFLICKMGLSREIAKALLIDAAAGWDRKDDVSHKIGYGIVPKHINDILYSPDDEIRFILTGVAEEYETYTYNLPVPLMGNTHPFYARATLAYFPKCNRNQGVDYTSTEMDIHFGRVKGTKEKAYIKSINNNQQGDSEYITLYEENARSMYRKWDNVKHINDEIKGRKVPRKAYESGLWGIEIKTKQRMAENNSDPLCFGIVITLKEMYGANRIDDFIKMCMSRGWLVNRLDVDTISNVYEKAEEEVEFD